VNAETEEGEFSHEAVGCRTILLSYWKYFFTNIYIECL